MDKQGAGTQGATSADWLGNTEKEEATFKASVPSISGWIRVGGDGGARVVLDVPDTSLADVLKLILWREQLLEVTVRPVPK